MEVIQIEENAQAIKPGILDITGNSNIIKIQNNTGHIVFHGNDSCIYLDWKTGQQSEEQLQVNDLLYQAFEVIQLLIILMIFFIILKIADINY